MAMNSSIMNGTQTSHYYIMGCYESWSRGRVTCPKDRSRQTPWATRSLGQREQTQELKDKDEGERTCLDEKWGILMVGVRKRGKLRGEGCIRSSHFLLLIAEIQT